MKSLWTSWILSSNILGTMDPQIQKSLIMILYSPLNKFAFFLDYLFIYLNFHLKL